MTVSTNILIISFILYINNCVWKTWHSKNLPFSSVPWPGCTAEVECPVLSHHPPQCSPNRPSWNHRCGAQVQDAVLRKSRQSLTISSPLRTQIVYLSSIIWYMYTILDSMRLVCFGSQLQLTQRIPVPQDPVSIIVPIVYDMATGLTQQADIPRQHSSSGAAALMVSNILKRFNELHPARPGETSTLNNLLYWH